MLSKKGVAWRFFCKKISLNSQENTEIKIFFLLKSMTWDQQLFKKESPTQVFSREFVEFFKNTSSYRTPPVAFSNGYFWENRIIPLVYWHLSIAHERIIIKVYTIFYAALIVKTWTNMRDFWVTIRKKYYKFLGRLFVKFYSPKL